MAKCIHILVFSFFFFNSFSQEVSLFDHLIAPSRDTALWERDFEHLNADYNPQANQCQTCISSHNEGLFKSTCFNTSLAHVRMDTALHMVTEELLAGKWKILKGGIIAIEDSIHLLERDVFRTQRVLQEPKKIVGDMEFTERRMNAFIKVSGQTEERINKKYKLIEGKHLMKKIFLGWCGPVMVGMNEDGILILDIISNSIRARDNEYLVYETILNRTFLIRRED